MKNSDKRKLKTISLILGIPLLSIIFYYLLYSYINNGGAEIMCQKFICIPILSLSEFLSIVIGLLGLYLVIDSLDSWKNQDAYYNSRDINLELNKLISICEFGIIIQIMELPQELPFEEKQNKIKSILPGYGIGSPISNLHHKIEYENIYYREEFNNLVVILERIISSIWNEVTKEKKDLKNIDHSIHVATRNQLCEAKELSRKLQDKLHDLIA